MIISATSGATREEGSGISGGIAEKDDEQVWSTFDSIVV